jgi:hypothetical protein
VQRHRNASAQQLALPPEATPEDEPVAGNRGDSTPSAISPLKKKKKKGPWSNLKVGRTGLHHIVEPGQLDLNHFPIQEQEGQRGQRQI